jgi:hypothetical protein
MQTSHRTRDRLVGERIALVPPLKMPEHKMARTAQEQQSFASGAAPNMSPNNAFVPLFATTRF